MKKRRCKVKKESEKQTPLTKTKIKETSQPFPLPKVEGKKEEKKEIKNVELEAFEFIKKYESFNSKAYWDYKHCSIGYGTTTRNCKEKITENEARARAIQKIKDIRKHNNFYDLDDNVEIALISFTYNLGKPPKNYRWYLKKGYKKALKNIMLEYVYAGGKKLKGLEKRRRAEVSLF